MFIPKLISIDFETLEINDDGSTQGSLEAYKHNFRIDSIACTWRNASGDMVSYFCQGEAKAIRVLKLLDRLQIPLVAHNIAYEMLVTACRAPDLKLNWYCCTMRLAQLWDGGGDKFAVEWVLPDDYVDAVAVEGEEQEEPELKKELTGGLGLVKCLKRILPTDYVDHKKEAHQWIRANVPECKKGKEGGFLSRLPIEILRRYNVADTERTLDLFEYLTEQYRGESFDWNVDHRIWLNSARRINDAYIRGVRVDRAKAEVYRREILGEMKAIEEKFLTTLAADIKKVERMRLLARIQKLKKIKGRKAFIKRYREGNAKAIKDVKFNVGSGQQLVQLFVDVLGKEVVFETPKGSPSTKSSHLYSYGEGGLLLAARKKRQLVLKQVERLLEKSAYDGRWHLQLRACGTVTGRFAGTGGLNVQAMARRDEGLMTCILPDEGCVFVSRDMSAGEPTIITHFTEDPYYRYFCFDGVGKKPYYDNGILMVDDIYLAYASVCPMFATDIRQAFDTGVFDGRSFAEAWMKDPETVKGHKLIKGIRKNAKWITLAFGYGLGPKTLMKKAIEAGMKVTFGQCKAAFKAYWHLFKGIKSYSERIEKHVEQYEYFVNNFGYRFKPQELRKSFNGFIQSSVSGLFHWEGVLIEEEAPYAKYVSTIHDEELNMIPIDKVEEFKQAQDRVVRLMNEQLKWSVDLRFGYSVGANFYEAK